jgi:hypothetical protein
VGSDLRQDTGIRDSTTSLTITNSITNANTDPNSITNTVPERYHVHEHCGLCGNKRHMLGLQLPTKRTNRDNMLLPTTTKSLAKPLTLTITKPITYTTTSKPSIPISKPKPTAECAATASTAFSKPITN